MRYAPTQLWSRAQAQAADAHAMGPLGAPSAVLMERVAVAAANLIEARWPALRRLDVVAGPGNNGADGLATARVLAQRGWDCEVRLFGPTGHELRAHQEDRARRVGVRVVEAGPLRAESVGLDAGLGTGARGAPRPAMAAALRLLEHGGPVVALDVPTGVDADDGCIAGVAARADLTITVARSKPGLHISPGREAAGEVVVVRVGIDGESGGDSPTGDARWISPSSEVIARALDVSGRIEAAAHKGARGHVGLWAGGPQTPGAAGLAATAALRGGAGLLTLVSRDDTTDALILAGRPELMRGTWAEASAVDAWIVGPGLTGLDAADREAAARRWSDDPRPAVWDAGGLAALAERGTEAIGAAHPDRGPRVLTPHPGEAAQLMSALHGAAVSASQVQAARASTARTLATSTGAVVLLKGAGTVVASPDGALAVCTVGSPALATAGTGDVLAGIIGAWLGHGVAAMEAACAAALAHAHAGEIAMADTRTRPPTALEVAQALPTALEQLTRGGGQLPTLTAPREVSA